MLKHLCGAAILGAGLALAATNANAVTLVDPTLSNTSVTFDEAAGRFTSWMVNGVEQLKTSPSFSGLYYSYNGSLQEQLNGFTLTSFGVDSGGNPVANLEVDHPGLFKAEVAFTFVDSMGIFDSQLNMTGKITAAATLNNFTVIDFTDLDLQGTASDDSLLITPNNQAAQIDQTKDVGYDAAYAFGWTKNLDASDTAKTLLFGFNKSIALDGSVANMIATDTDLDATTPSYEAGTAELGRRLANNDLPPVILDMSTQPGAITAAIPEPATTLLSAFGLSALGTLALRRRAAK